ncbi:MAG: hypothetical protein ABFD89_18995 [Bryobacteraceae bacterium]
MNLTSDQKELLRKIVDIYDRGVRSEFVLVSATHASGPGLLYGTARIDLDAECDLLSLQAEGLITLRRGSRSSQLGKPTESGLRAVHTDFAVANRLDPYPPSVFISCGQFTAEEIQIGKTLKQLVEEHTACLGYFAQNQDTVEGLSNHILAALGRCSGFVAVMHHRGSVSTPEGPLVRGSVWVEQEIAVAAFMTQVMSRKFPVAIYVQKGIAREGLRQFILSNAFEFKEGKEVIDNFRERLLSQWLPILNSSPNKSR